MKYDNLPACMQDRPRWVLWGLPGKPIKRPYSVTGQPASVTKPGDWAEFDCARMAAELWDARGLGYVLGDGLACVDFDDCFAADGQLNEWTAGWVARLGGWAERSQSGRGLHIFVRGQIPTAIKDPRAELYCEARFIALTGDVYGAAPETLPNAQQALDALADELRPRGRRSKALREDEPLDDDQRQQRLTAALAAGGELAQLWGCEQHEGDESGADFALSKAVYRALRPCAASDVLAAMGESPWVTSKDRKHASKWRRADYQSRTVRAALEDVAREDEEAAEGFVVAAEQGPWHGEFSLAELAEAKLPPVRWAIPGFLPAGLCLLVAAPKVGKSWLALDLCLAIAAGSCWLGQPAEKGAVLYFDLEDSPQRLQGRLRALLGDDSPAPAAVTVRLHAPTLGHGLEGLLDEWFDAHPDARLVIVDTFQRVRPPQVGRENAYALDYRACAALQSWAMRRGVCLLLVHHTRKALDSSDVFASISGSTGIFGAADAVLTITKRTRFAEAATLSITGRDVDARELAVEFDKASCRWRVLGEAQQVEAQRDPLVHGIQQLCDADEAWRGTAGELIDTLLAMDPGADVPQRGEVLGRRLRVLMPVLRAAGIEVTLQHDRRRRTISLRRLSQPSRCHATR